MNSYWDGIEDMILEERDLERAREAERLARLERDDELIPARDAWFGASSPGAFPAGGGQTAPADSSSHDSVPSLHARSETPCLRPGSEDDERAA